MPDAAPDQQLLDKARQLATALADDLEPGGSPVAVADPVLVWTLEGVPAYWVFPLVDDDTTIGALRLALGGEVISLATRSRHGSVTAAGIDHSDALSRAKDAVSGSPGTRLSRPRLVMDGYPGREAWLIEVQERDREARRLLISSGGIQELH